MKAGLALKSLCGQGRPQIPGDPTTSASELWIIDMNQYTQLDLIVLSLNWYFVSERTVTREGKAGSARCFAGTLSRGICEEHSDDPRAEILTHGQ